MKATRLNSYARLLIIPFMLVLAVTPSLVFAEEAPFGLRWGMSKESLESEGIRLNSMDSSGSLLHVYRSTSLPKNLSDAETYYLLFHQQYGLVKLNVVSENITGDTFGNKGKERYSALKQILIDRYGKPELSLEQVGIRLYQDRDEFYQCLAYDGCGTWVTYFLGKDGSRQRVELKGLRRGVGYFTIGYESPDFEKASSEQQQQKLDTDADAL